MVNRSTSNQRGEIAETDTGAESNTVKRNEGEVTVLDTTPTSESLAQPEDDKDEDTLS